MKQLYKNRYENYKFAFRVPEGPEHVEGPQDRADRRQPTPEEITRLGMDAANQQIGHISSLSPEAGQIVGQALPRLIERGIHSPEDARQLREAAAAARDTINAQLDTDAAPLGGQTSPEAADYPPEAYAEVDAWLGEVEAQMAAAQTALAAQADAHPDNADLQRHNAAFGEMVDEVRQLRTEAAGDLSVLEAQAAEGGVTGPLAERLAQIAQGEVGAVNSDAEGNAKYSRGVDRPWCADFTNWALEQAGGQGTGSSMAQSFVQGEGLGHVAIVVDDSGTTVGGNEGNAVREGGNASEFDKAISAEAVSEGRFDDVHDVAQAGTGDIVVRSRDAGPGASAQDQSVA